jgi:hypothetical protein
MHSPFLAIMLLSVPYLVPAVSFVKENSIIDNQSYLFMYQD